MSEWKLISDLPQTDGPGVMVLLFSKQFGIRTGEAFHSPHGKWANVGNLHGNAIDDWGATHWMPLPEPPQTPLLNNRTGEASSPLDIVQSDHGTSGDAG